MTNLLTVAAILTNGWIQESFVFDRITVSQKTDYLAVNYAPYDPTGQIHRITVDEIDDDLIRALVEKGHVCRVVGHKWQMGCPMAGCLVIHDSPLRHCIVCGKQESQKVGSWE